MPYTIVLDPDVSLALSLQPLTLQDWFNRQILPVLRENPYPSPGFPLISEYFSLDGRPFYEYYDGIVPLVFQYRVYESDVESEPGMVWVANALRDDEV